MHYYGYITFSNKCKDGSFVVEKNYVMISLCECGLGGHKWLKYGMHIIRTLKK